MIDGYCSASENGIKLDPTYTIEPWIYKLTVTGQLSPFCGLFVDEVGISRKPGVSAFSQTGTLYGL